MLRRETRFSLALFLNQAGNSVVILGSLLRNITLACIPFNDVITFFLLTPQPSLYTAIAFLLCSRDVHLAAIFSLSDVIWLEMILNNFKYSNSLALFCY